MTNVGLACDPPATGVVLEVDGVVWTGAGVVAEDRRSIEYAVIVGIRICRVGANCNFFVIGKTIVIAVISTRCWRATFIQWICSVVNFLAVCESITIGIRVGVVGSGFGLTVIV